MLRQHSVSQPGGLSSQIVLKNRLYKSILQTNFKHYLNKILKSNGINQDTTGWHSIPGILSL